jgi:hypothetical protein
LKVGACFVVVVAAGCASTSARETRVVSSSSASSPTQSVPVVESPSAVESPSDVDSSSDASAAIAAIAAAPVPSPYEAWAAAGGDGDGDVKSEGDAPEVKVSARRDGSTLREDRLIGENQQPEWTTERRFATTRAYVLAPGQIEVEQWLKMHNPRGESPDHFWQTEIAFGLPYRFQVDFYENYGDEGHDTPTTHEGNQIEARWALAEWGKIPLNPTLYEELVLNHRAADAIESKLLLAEDLAPGCHWALNVFHEQVMGDERKTELGAASGISWALLDSKFSVGAESKYERATENGSRGNANNELLVGPSFQWRPTENSHVDFVPLMGLTKSDRRDPRYEIYIVIGWDFGPERKEARAPTSSRSK